LGAGACGRSVAVALGGGGARWRSVSACPLFELGRSVAGRGARGRAGVGQNKAPP